MRTQCGLMVVGVVAATGASACGVFELADAPPEVVRAFENDGDPGCTAVADRARRVARAADVDGVAFELWMAPADGGGSAFAVVSSEPGQEDFGSAGWCSPSEEVDEVTEIGGIGMSTAGTERETTFGRAPPGAETIRVRAGSGRETVVEVGADGYFLVTRSERDGDDTVFEEPMTLTALDGDGRPLD